MIFQIDLKKLYIMPNKQCPNCNQYTLSKSFSAITIGICLIIGAFIVPFMIEGGAEYQGGHTDIPMTFLIMIILGIIILFKGIFFPSKTITFTCSNCKYEVAYKK
jgi:hypothetical protein